MGADTLLLDLTSVSRAFSLLLTYLLLNFALQLDKASNYWHSTNHFSHRFFFKVHKSTDLFWWCWANPATGQHAWWCELQTAGTVPSVLQPDWNTWADIKQWTIQSAYLKFDKHLRSVQEHLYAFKKAHIRSIPPLRNFPTVAFETVPSSSSASQSLGSCCLNLEAAQSSPGFGADPQLLSQLCLLPSRLAIESTEDWAVLKNVFVGLRSCPPGMFICVGSLRWKQFQCWSHRPLSSLRGRPECWLLPLSAYPRFRRLMVSCLCFVFTLSVSLMFLFTNYSKWYEWPVPLQ